MSITKKKLLALVAVVLACAASARAADVPPEALFKQLKAFAGTGNPEVKYNLGMFHNNGIATPRDNKTAFRYFSEAAEAGNLLAAYKVGCYYAGQFPGIVPLDEGSALNYKLRAAEGGYDIAQHEVAVQLARKGDLATAFVWWEKASRQGYMPSTAYLAKYLSGLDSKDKVKGLAMLLVFKGQVPDTTRELANALAAAQAELSQDDQLQAERIRASWVTGPTPLSSAARAGMSALPALLATLKQ